MASVDVDDLEAKVQQMYRQAAEQPHATYHFEMGRALAQRLGYPDDLLAAIPSEAVESFAGVGLTWRAFSRGRQSSIWAAAQEWTP